MEVKELDYSAAVAGLAAELAPSITALLERVRGALIEAGYPCGEVWDMSADDYRWAFSTLNDDGKEREGSVDIAVEIAEQRAYEGMDDETLWGVSFRIDVTGWGGVILGGFAPYNYTERCWVDLRDPSAVAERWALVDGIDATDVLGVMPSDPSEAPSVAVVPATATGERSGH